MSDDRNIWSPPDGRLSEEQLTAYLEGKGSDAERWEVEAWLAAEGAESDAIEGLESITAEEAQAAKTRINSELQRSLAKKKKRRTPLNNQREIMTAVLIVLLLLVICFGVMWWMKHGKQLPAKTDKEVPVKKSVTK